MFVCSVVGTGVQVGRSEEGGEGSENLVSLIETTRSYTKRTYLAKLVQYSTIISDICCSFSV